MAAQDLARPNTRPIGGAPMPDSSYDPSIYTPRPLAVALLTACLTTVATRLEGQPVVGGLKIQLQDLGENAELTIAAEGLGEGTTEAIARELNEQLGSEPTLEISGSQGVLSLSFKTLEAGGR